MTKKLLIRAISILIVFSIGFILGANTILFKEFLDESKWKDIHLESKLFWEDHNFHPQLTESFRNRFVGLHDTEIIEHLRLTNKNLEAPDEIDTDLLDNFDLLYQNWPFWLKTFAENHVVKIYIVKNLGSSGMAMNVQGNKLFILVVDQKILTESPNEWSSRIESTVLKKDSRLRITYQIENSDDSVFTLENLIIHELGHLFGVVNYLTPTFNLPRKNNSDSPFLEGVFSISYIGYFRNNEIESEFEKLNYYDSGEKMSDEDFLNLAQLLKSTSYPTFYSSGSAYEYFAESFYSYVHCLIQQKPYEMRIMDLDSNELVLFNGIIEERCAKEREIISVAIENYTNSIKQ